MQTGQTLNKDEETEEHQKKSSSSRRIDVYGAHTSNESQRTATIFEA